MQRPELYLPMMMPLWGIFLGIALIIIGYADKKSRFTYSGWAVLMATGLISLYFNLFTLNLSAYPEGSEIRRTALLLVATGWLNAAGSVTSLVTMLFYRYKNKRYVLMAVLNILFFSILFFQYYSLVQKPK